MSDLQIFQFDDEDTRTEVRATMDQEGEPWFVLKDVLDAMGSKTTTTNAKSSIEQGLGDGYSNEIAIVDSLGRNQNATIISEAAATFLVTRSNTDTGRKLNRWIHKEVLPQIRKTGSFSLALPDFSSPAAAARAWADAYEAEQAAKAQVLALEHQITQDQPYTELAKAITGSSTMYVRDWIALMKEDHQASFKESQVREFLHETGYWYWTQTTPKATRAYGHFSHLFKLEVEMINGYPRDVLKITGQGVLELTPVIIKHFSKL